jgi:acetyl-CoA synthetase
MTDMNLVNPIVRRWLEEAREGPERFWAAAAAKLHWFRPWERIFEWNFPTFRWFIGAETNLAYNALDRHVQEGWGGHTALIYANERGERRLFTYAQLLRQVERTAAALRGLGLQKGDRLTIYMPVCPEAIVLMLATVRIGAIHSVVFAGFGAGALGDRIRASGSRAVFVGDLTYRKGKDVPLKGIADAALEGGGHSVERVVVFKRGAADVPMQAGRDISWDEFMAAGAGQTGEHVAMEANEPAFILATSGTTAKPKLAVHTHGAYQVWIASMARWMFGLQPEDVWWSMSDIGWIVGHSYIVYAPLIMGCTTLAYEGAIDYPDPSALWKIVEEFSVTGIFTSPTAVRLLMRYGESHSALYDHSSLTRLFCAGEVLNAPAWEWLQQRVFKDRIPVIDHMWQTETGGPVFGNPYGISMLPIKPGSAGIPLAGIEARVVTAEGEPCPAGEKGIMVVTKPFPGLIQSIWGEPERYKSDYWGRVPPVEGSPGVYYMGDAAHFDADGYAWFAGRADEVIKIASHRLGTIEVETALLRHPAVAEAGVTGRPDDLRGEVISAFVVLRAGRTPSEALKKELVQTVHTELGALAVVGEIHFVGMLPKTRSGKIMRRVFKAVILGRDPGDISTIEDESSVEEARQAWTAMMAEIAKESSEEDLV